MDQSLATDYHCHFKPAQLELLDALVRHNTKVSPAAAELGVGSQSVYTRLRTIRNRIPRDVIIKAYPALIKLFPPPPGAQDKAPSTEPEAPPPITPIKPDELLPATVERLCAAVAHITDYRLQGAKVSELNSLIKTLFEVSQVLQGKPTSISHSENVKALKDLVPALVKEATRRGIDIEGEVVDVQGPGPEAHPPGGSGAGPVEPRPQSEFSKFLDANFE